jgi:hypothetical protein
VRGLHRQPATRSLLHAVPAIARRTVGSIARQAAHGTPVTAGGAVRTLATQARRVLGYPQQRRQALRRSAVLDRRFHRYVGPGAVRPHGRAWYTGYGPAPYVAPPAGPAYPGGPVRRPAQGGWWPGYQPAAPYVAPPAGPAYPGGPVRRPAAGGRCPSCPPCPYGRPAYCSCCGQLVR